MMTNQNGSGPGSSSEQVVHKRCTICNVPFINPDLINVHYRHHMTPKICVILGTDEDGNQKYVELTQQQALAYNAGALPILQNAIGAGGGQQYILADQGGQFKTFDGGSQQLIATAYQQGAANSLGGEAVEMVHYVDSSGHELSPDEVQYYALDGQEYSVIQANEEIVVSTEARLPHEEQQQQLVIEEASSQPKVVMAAQPGKAKGRATKRKNSASATSEPPKTYSRRGGHQAGAAASGRGVSAKKLLLADDQSTFTVSAASKQQVQSLQPQHILQQQQPDGSMISFVTTAGQTHHVSAAAAAAAANHHIDLHQVASDQFLSPSSISGEEIVVSHVSPAKLKSEPLDHVASLEGGSDGFHAATAADLKPLGLKVEPHQQQLLQQQQQQYIVLAYDNESGIHQLQQAAGKANNVTVVEGFDLKEEKVTV